MLNQTFEKRNVLQNVRVGVKGAVALAVIALAVLLPQMVHLAFGAGGGAALLPMYLPVIIGGVLLGTRLGFAVGVLSPLVSFLVTSLMGNAMPAAERLPYMMAELAVFAAVSGHFSGKVYNRGAASFVAVASAFVLGRIAFVTIAAVTDMMGIGTVSVTAALMQVRAGIAGMVLQLVLVPVIMIVLRRLILKSENER